MNGKVSDIKERIEYTNHILDKKFELYEWINSKANIMVVINTALLSLAMFAIDKWITPTGFNYKQCWFWLWLLSTASLAGGICLSLFVAIPTVKSGIWKKHKKELIAGSLRTVMGISSMTPSNYQKRMEQVTEEEMLQNNADEIVKVNYNISIDICLLRWTAGLTLFGIVLLISSFAARAAIS
jgi:hypothetical protein